ncbi:sulfotransferase 1C2-like [Chironomus tepperi]|uniref:sulfotransferase 1C2-like n=1 Tax=Chironomus tepperi TaxID=113505 RepID=UPI00391F859C
MYNIEVLNSDLTKKLGTAFMTDYVRISLKDDPSKFCIMSQHFVDNYLEKIKNMEIFEDDVWVITFPKCGTTWTQEMVWMLGNNLDYETSMKIPLDDKFPFMECSGIAKEFPVDTFGMATNQPRPRYIKSHLPIFLLPDQLWTVKPKIIYVTRNPKDAAVSWYHHYRNMAMYKGTKAEFIEAFSKDLVLFSPMNNHVIDFWNIRFQPNILFLFFEDMKRNLPQEVKKVMKFMDKNYSQDDIDKLCVHLSFDSIQKNKMINKEDTIQQISAMTGQEYNPQKYSFIRKGKIGGYKQELTITESDMLDEYIKKAEYEIEYKF